MQTIFLLWLCHGRRNELVPTDATFDKELPMKYKERLQASNSMSELSNMDARNKFLLKFIRVWGGTVVKALCY